MSNDPHSLRIATKAHVNTGAMNSKKIQTSREMTAKRLLTPTRNTGEAQIVYPSATAKNTQRQNQ